MVFVVVGEISLFFLELVLWKVISMVFHFHLLVPCLDTWDLDALHSVYL